MRRYQSWCKLAVVVAYAALCAACSNNLSKERADELLRTLPQIASGKADCSVFFSPKSDNKWEFTKRNKGRCAAGLEQAGLARIQNCASESYGDCEIAPTGKSRFVGNELTFDCGTLKYLGVTSITTEGNKAKAKYEREVVLDEHLLLAIKECQITKTEDGRREREREFSRDDAGKWSLTGK